MAKVGEPLARPKPRRSRRPYLYLGVKTLGAMMKTNNGFVQLRAASAPLKGLLNARIWPATSASNTSVQPFHKIIVQGRRTQVLMRPIFKVVTNPALLPVRCSVAPHALPSQALVVSKVFKSTSASITHQAYTHKIFYFQGVSL
jgi:hypothetical protein